MSRSRPKTRRSLKSNPRGILTISTSGHGFVRTSEGEFFISSSKLGGAFDGDAVELLPLTSRQSDGKKNGESKQKKARPSARVVRVIERAHELIIGRYEVAEPFGVVVPHDHRIPYDIFTMRSDNPDIEDGAIVKVRMVQYPSRNSAATGVVEEVIGGESAQSLPIDIIIARHKIETHFSEDSLREAELLSLDNKEAKREGYRDITDRVVFTIDPEDARDFDDAVSLEKADGTWRLGVHIADVARFVPWGSSIDLDARRRATSVYLVDRVIPMLPEALSNELCSLKPLEERFTLTVDMYLSDKGVIQDFEIFPSIITSKRRFSYGEVQTILEEKKEKGEFVTRLLDLQFLMKQVLKNAKREGRIDFPSVEAKVRLDEKSYPIDIDLRSSTDATMIIEQAMILANTTVAQYLVQKQFPCVYRVHEKPSSDALLDLVPILQEFEYLQGIDMNSFVAGDPFTIEAILEASKGRPTEELISSLLLRSMMRARYDENLSEHYGLALARYCHFTSPIRRYPDLVVHRMLHAQLGGKPETFEEQVHNLHWLSNHSSEMERVAESAARESQTYKMVEYLANDVGNVFDAVISGVVASGIFVRLENTAEGMVSIKDLGNEYFSFDRKRHILQGEETGKKFRLGQRLRVILQRADLNLGRLDFTPVNSTQV